MYIYNGKRCEGNAEKRRHSSIHLPSPAQLQDYPVLRSLFAQERSDPRTCTYQNEMVLVWKQRDNSDKLQETDPKYLHEMTIDEVMGSLVESANRDCNSLQVHFKGHNYTGSPGGEVLGNFNNIASLSDPCSNNSNVKTYVNKHSNSVDSETLNQSFIDHHHYKEFNADDSNLGYSCKSYDHYHEGFPDLAYNEEEDDDDEVFENENITSTQDQKLTLVQCENPSCRKNVPLYLACNHFKNCHNCCTSYCGRPCRQQDWTRHKTLCSGSLINSACKHVLKLCNKDPGIKEVLSRLARRGFICKGRGCIMLGLPDLRAAQTFLGSGLVSLELKPIYVTAHELRESVREDDNSNHLLNLCYSYDPDMKFVLNVGIGVDDDHVKNCSHICRPCSIRAVSSESDGGYGSIDNSLNYSRYQESCSTFHDVSHIHQRFLIVQRCVKLRLSPLKPSSHVKKPQGGNEFAKRSCYGSTLIICGVPGMPLGTRDRQMRELIFLNAQRKLRERGVNLKVQFPQIYHALLQYVVKGSHFPSQIIYPVDTVAKQLFMCVLMPECEPDLDWTQSLCLLQDLDLSERDIWRTVSETKCLPAFVSSPAC